MAKDPKPLEEFTEKAKDAVEQTKQQLLAAVDTYFNFLQKTISSYPSGGSELGEKLKSYAEKNIAATHEFLQKLGQAKSFPDVARIQSEFMQAQVNALGEQAKNIGEASTEAVTDAMKTKTPVNRSS